MKPVILICLYLVGVTVPLVASWYFGGPPRALHQELASGLGILAFSMILMEFVLSGRFKSISNGVGIDVTQRLHQMLARTALAFVILHPLLYQGTPSGGARPWDPTRQLTLTTDLSALSTGIAAYLLLPVLVLLAIGRKHLDHSYETWRLMHGVAALVVALLVLHHAVYAGRYGGQTAMTWLWLTGTAAAVGSMVYVYLLVPLRDRARAWRVVSVVPRATRQWELTVTPRNHAGLDYKAGQFVWLNVGHSSFSLKENPFSISSAPAAGPDVSFLIKELGDFTGSVGRIKPGTVAYLDGPFGSLSVDGRDEPGVALIAGGVGIAPLLGILRQLRLSRDPRKIRIVYGSRVIDQIAYRDELDAEDTTYVLSEPPPNWQGETGMIGGALLDRMFSTEEMRDWVFVICGPTPMMETIEDHLLSRGTRSSRILSERFDYD